MTTAYLIEFSYYLDDDTTVCLFSADELTTWLRKNFESHHYTSDGYDVARLFRYADGMLTPLDIRSAAPAYLDDNDYIHSAYEIRHDNAADLTFTVTIDGRA